MIIIDIFRGNIILEIYLSIIVKPTLHNVFERRSIKRKEKIKIKKYREKRNKKIQVMSSLCISEIIFYFILWVLLS